MGEVFKLVKNGVVEEVEQKDVLCCNPLSVASNKKGKKRLCLDLSRQVNLACKAQKFRIESVQDFVKVVADEWLEVLYPHRRWPQHCEQ